MNIDDANPEPPPTDATLAAERERLAAEVRGEAPEPAELIESGKQVVIDTFDVIQTSLAAKRAERELIDAEIAELVEAEQLWKPLYRRVTEGIVRRAPRETGPE